MTVKMKMTMQPTKREVGYPPLVASGGSSEVAGEARRPIRGRRTPRAHERGLIMSSPASEIAS